MGSTLASNVEGEDIVWPSRETLEKFIKELRVKASRVNIPRHGQIMMKMSVLMNCMIPLLCHFMYKKGITNSTEFLLSAYDILIHLYDVDIYNKLYETANSNVQRTAKRNAVIWGMQDIRGINTDIHSLQSVQNILINIFY